MHSPNNPVCFPHIAIDSKHDFTNSNERNHSYVWNLMHNSVQRISKIDSFQNVWKMILMSCCSPSVTVNTHTKKMLWTFSFMTKATISAPKKEWSNHFLVGIIWNYTQLNPLPSSCTLNNDSVTKKNWRCTVKRGVFSEFPTLGTTTTLKTE